MAAKKRKEMARAAANGEDKDSPARRKTKVMDTVQATDHDAAIWDIKYSRAQMGDEVETESVGNPYDDDPMGRKRGTQARRRRQ